MKGFVFVQDHLDEVIARGDVVEVADGVAEGSVVKRNELAGLYGVHVEAEDHLRAHGVADLQARFGGGIGGENQEQAAVERSGALFIREGDCEAIRWSLLCVKRGRR